MKNECKLVNVNLLHVMAQIVDAHTQHYKSDFDIDRATLRAIAGQKEDTQERSFLWLCRESGTWLLNERNAFMKDTAEHITLRFYAEQELSSDILAYVLEPKRLIDGRVFGNIYSVDYLGCCQRVQEKAMNTNVIMHFEHGTRTAPFGGSLPRVDSEYGKLQCWEYLPSSNSDMLELLKAEKKAREKFREVDVGQFLAGARSSRKPRSSRSACATQVS